MTILAKLTSISIILLLSTYFVVFYGPIIQKLISPQEVSPTTVISILTPTPTSKMTTTPILTTTPETSTPSITLTVDQRCIITIDGSRYDVTQLRDTHSGGDIFQCGSDMSTIFHDRHSSRYLQQMAQYKI